MSGRVSGDELPDTLVGARDRAAPKWGHCGGGQLHDGRGRGSLGNAVDAALEMGLELLLADIAQSAAPQRATD